MKTFLSMLSIFTISSISHAGFSPIDDAELGVITGKAGVSIEADVRATIGSLEYIDEGSIVVSDIVIGGANKQTYFGINWGPGSHSGNKLDGSLITIDVLNNGDLVIAGGVDPSVGGIIDFGLSTGSIALHSADKLTSATLINSIDISGVATKFRMKIDAATSHILTEAEIGIADLDIDMSELGIKIENGFIASSSYFESVDEWGAQAIALDDIVAVIRVDIHADDEGLHINPESLEFDMGIGSILVADASIGSFALDNVDLSNIAVTISGHP